jgi:hypothetical protein
MARLGYRQAPGRPNRMISPSGETVTRASYRNAVAQAHGYRNDRERRGHATGDERYANAFLNTEQGNRLREQAQAMGKTEGELKQQIIAARNGRHHGGNAAYHQFMSDYDYEDYEPVEWDVDS